MDPRTPVVVGVGQITVRDGEPLEPLALMEAAARAAAEDAGRPELLERLQSIVVVDALSAPLGDPGAALATRLGASPAQTLRTGRFGGNGPQTAVNHVAAQVLEGLDVALVVGAEAMATVQALRKRGESPSWALGDDHEAPQLVPDQMGASEAEAAGGLHAPIFVYPLFEHALRGAAGRTPDEHAAHVARFWSGFSAVAAENPHAWSREAFTPEEIATVSADNRRVSDPYNKRHNANIGVDQGAALLICSAEVAGAGDHHVYPWAGAAATDHWNVTERDELHRSPAIRLCGEAVFGHTGVDALGPVDLYSCFPSAVQLGAEALGLSLDRELTRTGGLAFFGGPGNNYATHGIAEVVRSLRGTTDVGLSTSLGWYATKHAVGLYSAVPPERPFAAYDVQDAVDALPRRELAEGYAGEATVETYTAIFERDGSPGTGIVIGRLGDGRRVAVKSHDADEMAALLAEDPLGRTVTVTAPEGFHFS